MASAVPTIRAIAIPTPKPAPTPAPENGLSGSRLRSSSSEPNMMPSGRKRTSPKQRKLRRKLFLRKPLLTSFLLASCHALPVSVLGRRSSALDTGGPAGGFEAAGGADQDQAGRPGLWLWLWHEERRGTAAAEGGRHVHPLEVTLHASARHLPHHGQRIARRGSSPTSALLWVEVRVRLGGRLSVFYGGGWGSGGERRVMGWSGAAGLGVRGATPRVAIPADARSG